MEDEGKLELLITEERFGQRTFIFLKGCSTFLIIRTFLEGLNTFIGICKKKNLLLTGEIFFLWRTLLLMEWLKCTVYVYITYIYKNGRFLHKYLL